LLILRYKYCIELDKLKLLGYNYLCRNLTREKKCDIVSKEDKLLQKLKEICRRVEYGSLTLKIDIHEGIITQCEISDVKEKIR